VIISVAIVVVVLFHRFKLPSIAGFILSGLLVGPNGLRWINDTHQVEMLAEIGVALLLFGIGVELSLDKLKKIWRLAAIGGFLQVVLTTLAAYGVSISFGFDGKSSLTIGIVVALSSTAIVMKGLEDRGEINAPHGRLILGILVFQDFSVVPAMLLIPMLIGVDFTAGQFIINFGKSIGIIIVVLFSAILLVPRILEFVAKTRQRQLFILSVFVVCLGTAWMVTMSGASLAIGAFLAGLVVAGSKFRHQATADILAFKEVFASLFFVSIGMLVSPRIVLYKLEDILILLTFIIVGKALIVFIVAMIMKFPMRPALSASLALAQVGEFSFVVIYSILGTGLLPESIENNLVTASIISMFITPFIISFGPKLAAGLGKMSWLQKSFQIGTVEENADTIRKMKDHVIIAGYGFAGRELATSLKKLGVPFLVIDLNIENVKRASEEVGDAVYGDITSESVLRYLEIQNAKELVLLINDPMASEQTVQLARKLAPELYITVRTTYLLDIQPLEQAGANEVIPAEREAAVQVTSQVLKRIKVSGEDIVKQASTIREHIEED
ncbi:MAG: hypothetical protein DWP97_09485, partial [Calditrichaeota bacterium]